MHFTTLTSNSQADLGEIKPACPRKSGVPCFLNWNTLNDNGDASEEGDEDGPRHEGPDENCLYLISYDPEKKDANGAFPYTNDHEPGHLAEDFIFESGPINFSIANVSEKSSETVGCRHGDEDGVKNLKNLQNQVSRLTIEMKWRGVVPTSATMMR